MTNDDKPARLLWASARMQLACAEHAPPIASAEWWAGQWTIFGEPEQHGYERARGEPAHCWACRALSDAAAMQGDAR